MAYVENDWRAYELYHHGILGMHWGVQNGPPYPLDSSVSTGSRLKASGGASRAGANRLSRMESGGIAATQKSMEMFNYDPAYMAYSYSKLKTAGPKKLVSAAQSIHKSARGAQEAFEKFYNRPSGTNPQGAAKEYRNALDKYNRDIDKITRQLVDINDTNYNTIRKAVESIAQTEGVNKAYGDFDISRPEDSYNIDIPQWEYNRIRQIMEDARSYR